MAACLHALVFSFPSIGRLRLSSPPCAYLTPAPRHARTSAQRSVTHAPTTRIAPKLARLQAGAFGSAMRLRSPGQAGRASLLGACADEGGVDVRFQHAQLSAMAARTEG